MTEGNSIIPLRFTPAFGRAEPVRGGPVIVQNHPSAMKPRTDGAQTHTVKVKKKGYEDWLRSMNVAGNSVHLSADLTSKAAGN